VPKDWKQLRDIAEFFHRPDENRYGVAIYTDNSYDAMAMGVENALFSYGGELGDYATYKVDGIINSEQRRPKPSRPTRSSTASRLRAGPRPSSSKNNQAITENLAAMSMNYFAFFPALVNEAIQPERQEYRLLRQPGRSGRRRSSRRSAARASRSSPTAEPGRGDEVPRMVHQGRDPEEVG
jgi:multiple sugar transport system substrate-binding protein